MGPAVDFWVEGATTATYMCVGVPRQLNTMYSRAASVLPCLVRAIVESVRSR